MSLKAAYTLRSATEADSSFLAAVYASTRTEELAVTGWSDEQKAAFCTSQFQAQTTHYLQHYPQAEYFVIEFADIPAGRLYMDRRATEIRIMDIALLPEHRGKGLGTQILQTLQAEATGAQKSLSIHVEKFNPALLLYQRLGFVMKEDKGVYLLMEWSPTRSLS